MSANYGIVAAAPSWAGVPRPPYISGLPQHFSTRFQGGLQRPFNCLVCEPLPGSHGCGKPQVRVHMARHLQELMSDAELYGWPTARSFHAVWDQEFEKRPIKSGGR